MVLEMVIGLLEMADHLYSSNRPALSGEVSGPSTDKSFDNTNDLNGLAVQNAGDTVKDGLMVGCEFCGVARVIRVKFIWSVNVSDSTINDIADGSLLQLVQKTVKMVLLVIDVSDIKGLLDIAVSAPYHTPDPNSESQKERSMFG